MTRKLARVIRKAKRKAGLDPNTTHPVVAYYNYIPDRHQRAFWEFVVDTVIERDLRTS